MNRVTVSTISNSQCDHTRLSASKNRPSNATTKNFQINKTILNIGIQFQNDQGKDLDTFCTTNFADFNLINTTTALNVCAKGYQKLSKKDKNHFVQTHAPLIKQLIKKALEKLQDGEPRHIAQLAWASARLNLRGEYVPSLFDAISAEALEKIRDFKPQELANTAWAFATLGIKDNKLFDAIAKATLEKIRDFNPQELANTSWAFATLDIKHDKLFGAMAKETLEKIRDLKPQELTNISWAFATLGIKDDKLFDAIAKATLEKIQDFNSQDLANTSWAFATLGIKDDKLFDAIAKEALEKIQDFSPQGLTNTAWAFATLGIKDDKLFDAIAKEALGKIQDFNSQDLANTAWAFATLGIEHDKLFDAIAKEALGKIQDFNPQNLANIAWAFATLGIKDGKLFITVAEKSQQKIRDFKPQELANTAWAFATLGIKDDKLFNAISTESLEKIRDFNTQNLANTAWAFATLGIKNNKLLDAISIESQQKIRDFNAQDLANTAWTLMLYSLFNATNAYHPLLILLIRNLNAKTAALRKEDLGEIYQVLLYLEHFSSEKLDSSSNLQAKIDVYLKTLSKTPPQSSDLHKFVQTALETLLKKKLSSELFVEGFFIDIVLDPAKKIAIEVDGPSHFLNTGEMRGNNLIKDKLLEKLGWTVFHVSYRAWNALKSEEEKGNYLKTLLHLKENIKSETKKTKEEIALPPKTEKKEPTAPVTNVWLTRGNPLQKQPPTTPKRTMNPNAKEFKPNSDKK